MHHLKQFSQYASHSDYVPTSIADGVCSGTSSIHGMGLFADRFFRRGDLILVLGGFLFSLDQVRAGLARPESLTGYSDQWYLGSPKEYPGGIDEYLNHSCDPNLWLKDETRIVARRSIEPREELTIDYATFEIDDEWRMPSPCNCGSPLCPEHITGTDWQSEALQRRYSNHFISCLKLAA